MSVHVTSWVLKHSEETLGNRLVLFVLADKAHDDGSASYPSVATIAEQARLSERQVQYCLKSLKESGAIVSDGKSWKGTNVYRVVMEEGGAIFAPPGAISDSGGVQYGAEGVKPIAPEPSLEPSLDPSTTATASPRNVIWDTLTEYFGSPTTAAERSDFGKTVKQIKEAVEVEAEERQDEDPWGPGGYVEREIRRRCDSVDPDFLTHRSLRNRWTELGRKADPPEEPDERVEEELDDCVYCDGTGIDTVTKVFCKDCHGTGQGTY